MVTGCTGFIYALSTAQQFIASGTYDPVLVIGAELLSRFIDWTDRSTCVLFGDRAGAVVLRATNTPSGVLAFVLGSDGSGGHHLILPAGGSAHPPSLETIEKGMHTVRMNGPIDLFIPHQANVRIIQSAAKFAGLPQEKMFINVEKYGNTSAVSIPIALAEALEQGRAQIGSTLAFVAFGAGLTWASAVVKIVEQDGPMPLRPHANRPL